MIRLLLVIILLFATWGCESNESYKARVAAALKDNLDRSIAECRTMGGRPVLRSYNLGYGFYVKYCILDDATVVLPLE